MNRSFLILLKYYKLVLDISTITTLIILGNFGSLGHFTCKATAATRTVLPIPTSVCSTHVYMYNVFLCIWAVVYIHVYQCLGFLKSAQMLTHAIAQGVNMSILRLRVRVSTLKADWEKNPLLHLGLEPSSNLCLVLSLILYQLFYPAPIIIIIINHQEVKERTVCPVLQYAHHVGS